MLDVERNECPDTGLCCNVEKLCNDTESVSSVVPQAKEYTFGNRIGGILTKKIAIARPAYSTPKMMYGTMTFSSSEEV